MGWLDEYFSPQGYQSPVMGGLLQSLAQASAANPGPSQGFPGGALGNGGPLMPLPNLAAMQGARGDAGPYFPPQASSTTAPAPSAPEGPSMLSRILSGIGSGLNDNSNALMAFGGATMTGGLGRGFSAAAAASPLDVAARKERQGNAAISATYQALYRQQIAQGVAPPEAHAVALAASQNPEILKTVIGPQFQHVQDTNLLGETRTGAFNPRTGQTTYPQSGGGTSSGIPEGLQGQELLDYLKKNNPMVAAGVEGIIRGDINAGGRNLQKLLPVAALVDPTLHQFDYATRAKTSQNYTSGPGALESKAANTAIEHAHQLSLIDDKLGGVDLGGSYANKAIQGVKGLYDSKFQDARREWDAKSELLSVEVAKVINGGVPHVADKEHWRQVFSAASTPTERKAAIRSAMEIIQGREGAAEEAYRKGMGSANAGFTFINPQSKERYQSLLNYGREMPQSTPPSPAGQSQGSQPVPKVTTTGVRWSVQ